mmetsp:Transcript_3505/g.6840  ORF Transcript_3505/g.6840 Transcript_3505/m.6840 type:complete len:584 (+) Transcript_3505:114-1865(+)
MVTYGLKQLLDDASARLRSNAIGQSSGPQGRQQRQQTMEQVWEVVDRYCSACLEQKRGLVLQNFCRIGWLATKLRGSSTWRPYFQLLDSFCRNWGVTAPRSFCAAQDQDLCPIEEFNFSKAAIRFSAQLTRDVVSAGLRALVQQIGQAMSQGRQVVLDLSFGRLVAEDRIVRLDFSPELLMGQDMEPHELQQLSEVETDAPRPVATFSATGPSRQQLRGLNVIVSKASQGEQPQKPAGGRSGHSSGSAVGSTAQRVTAAIPRAADGSGGVATPRQPNARSQHVNATYSEALHREITALEMRASEAMRDRAEMEGGIIRDAMQETRRKAERQSQERQNAEFLQRQMEAREARRQTERAAASNEREGEGAQQQRQRPPTMPALDLATLERRNMLTSTARETHARSLSSSAGGQPPGSARGRPPTASSFGGGGGGGGDWNDNGRRRARSELGEALKGQMQANRDRREASKDFERYVEKTRLEQDQQDTEARVAFVKAAKAREREELNSAWREEKRLRDIKRSIEAIELGRAPQPLTHRRQPPSSAAGDSSFGPVSPGPPVGPHSARGDALTTAALMSLQGSAVVAA